MSDSSLEIDKRHKNEISAHQVFLLSVSAKEYLLDKHLTVQITDQPIAFPLRQPYSIALMPEQGLFDTNFDYPNNYLSKSTDYHLIKKEWLAANIKETMGHIINKLSLPETVRLWPLYTFAKPNSANPDAIGLSIDINKTALFERTLIGFIFREQQTPTYGTADDDSEWMSIATLQLEQALIPIENWANDKYVSVTLKYEGQEIAVSKYCEKTPEFLNYRIEAMVERNTAKIHELKQTTHPKV